jgi:hypothetical protein
MNVVYTIDKNEFGLSEYEQMVESGSTMVLYGIVVNSLPVQPRRDTINGFFEQLCFDSEGKVSDSVYGVRSMQNYTAMDHSSGYSKLR